MTAREMSNQLSFIEQIAQDIEGWGEGWRWLYNPDDHGKRARINRAHSIDVDVEIEIDDQTGWFYVFARQFVRRDGAPWETVSFSARNPVNRRALDYINQQLDELC